MASSRKVSTDLGKRASRVERKNDASVPGNRQITASRSVTVRVPLALNRRGWRKLVVTPNGGPAWSTCLRLPASAVREATSPKLPRKRRSIP